MIDFKLPFLGADVDEGKLLQWRIQPGDLVKRGQVVAVVDTSKAAVDVESWQEGTVRELLVEPGQTVPVGTVLATLIESDATLEPGARAQAQAAPEGALETEAPALKAVPTPAPAATDALPRAAVRARRRVSPAARKHAEDRGIDIDAVVGTGPDGAVTLQDVQLLEAAVPVQDAPRRAPEESAEPEAETVVRVPIDQQPSIQASRQAEMRKAIAAAMSRSKREIPHYYLSETVPMRKAQDWLAAANAPRSITERLLMATLQLKAVALSLKKFPGLNGFFLDGAHQPSQAIHVGVAISLRQGGLIAPAIHDVAEKSLEQLMRDLTDLVQRARAGSLRSSEMSDPTVTVTNLGEQGVETVFGVIYPPQVALVGFGRMREMPWSNDGGLFVMPAVNASLAADHRVSDGHTGALFLADLRARLQHPEQL